MNGNFRRPEFVKRYEYNYYDLETPLNANVANNTRQTKNNYRFTVDNSSEANPIDWYNAYLEVDFKFVQLADGAGITAGTGASVNFCTTTNGQTFVKEIQVECKLKSQNFESATEFVFLNTSENFSIKDLHRTGPKKSLLLMAYSTQSQSLTN